MPFALLDGRVFTGDQILEGRAVLVEDGLVSAVLREDDVPAGMPVGNLRGGLLAPGFIDLQVNGGGGVLFNDEPTVEGIRTIGATHRRYGTTGFLPTLITDGLEVVGRAIGAAREAMAEGVPGVLGIHLEGPFLNPKRKGVHDQKKMRVMDEAACDLLCSLGTGVTLVTLAPETVQDGLVRRLALAGVVVAAGHTAATFEQIAAARREGVSGFTHLFNAMTPLTGRKPGVVGAALDDPDSWFGIVVDGYHVHPASLRIAIAAKPPGRVALVTDAMPTVGSDNPTFLLNGERITAVEGCCATAEGTLAGSDLDMASAVRNSVDLLGLPLEESLRMASAYPAQIIGQEQRYGRIEKGYAADFVLLGESLEVKGTWINGKGDGAIE